MTLVETGHHEVNADCDPDLGAHGVLCGAEEGFDAQVLFDPFEEEFDLPPAFIDCCNGNSRQFEVVGKKDKSLSTMSIEKTDTPEWFWIVTFSFPCAQADCLVASQSGGLIDGSRLMDVVDRPIGNTDKYRDRARQVDLGMQFDRGLCFAEVRPREHRKAKVDGCGIDSIDHLFEIESVGVLGIKSASFADEDLPECFIDTPVAELVRIIQISSRDAASDTHRVALWTVAQTSFDIPQTLAESDLSESHCKELIACRHPFAGSGHRVQFHAAIELLSVNEIGYLREDETSGVHLLLRMESPKACQPVQMRHTTFEPLAD